MSRLLLAGLVVAGWTAAGMGQTAPPTPMPPAGAGAGVKGTVTTQPATGTGLVAVPGTVAPAGMAPAPIAGVVTGNCGLATGGIPVSTTADSGRRMRLFRR